jgi:hypothetical protein
VRYNGKQSTRQVTSRHSIAVPHSSQEFLLSRCPTGGSDAIGPISSQTPVPKFHIWRPLTHHSSSTDFHFFAQIENSQMPFCATARSAQVSSLNVREDVVKSAFATNPYKDQPFAGRTRKRPMSPPLWQEQVLNKMVDEVKHPFGFVCFSAVSNSKPAPRRES